MTYLTDVTTPAQIEIGFSHRLNLRIPKLGIGSAISKVPSAVAHAFEMAYLTPFSATQRQPSRAGDVDFEGRDPNW